MPRTASERQLYTVLVVGVPAPPELAARVKAPEAALDRTEQAVTQIKTELRSAGRRMRSVEAALVVPWATSRLAT